VPPGAARQTRFADVLRWLLAAAYVAAGVLHIALPGPFVMITPDWVPWPQSVVFLTGVAEIAGAIGLFVPGLRKAAGVGLALYALCVWPANIKHAMLDHANGWAPLGPWYHAPRLAFQPVIVWWALFASGVTRWPFARAGTPPIDSSER
jgi:uncharacterized membrane protein